MFTACPLGAFLWWNYLFDERIEILMAMEISIQLIGLAVSDISPDRMIPNVWIDK